MSTCEKVKVSVWIREGKGCVCHRGGGKKVCTKSENERKEVYV